MVQIFKKTRRTMIAMVLFYLNIFLFSFGKCTKMPTFIFLNLTSTQIPIISLNLFLLKNFHS